MTYETREVSRYAGAPIEYIQFSRNGVFWRYTSDVEDDTTFRGFTWLAVPGVTRSDISQSDETTTMQLQISLPRTATVAQLFIGSPSPEPIRVLWLRNHRGESTAEGHQVWSGYVVAAEFHDSVLTLTCTTTEASQGGQLGKVPYARLCPVMLYGPLCGADRTAHTFDATVTAVSVNARTVTVTGPGDLGATPRRYTAGVLKTPNGESHFILKEDAAGEMILQTPAIDVLTGDTVQVTRGCDHSFEMCVSPFDNRARFAGYPLIPRRNVHKRIT